MNIRLNETKFNRFEKILCTFSQEELKTKEAEGYVAKKIRVYNLEMNGKQYQVECPILMGKDGLEVLILPAIKSPYRRYPVQVYIYAVARYLSGLSMRKTAKEIKKRFGIAKFSHSTISRINKLLQSKGNELFFLTELTDDTTPSDISSKSPETHNKFSSLPGSPSNLDGNRDFISQLSTNSNVPSNNLSKTTDKPVEVGLSQIFAQVLINPDFGITLAYRYFLLYGRLLI